MRTHTIAEALNTPTEVTALAVTEPGDTPWQAVIPQLTGLVCLHLGRGVDTDPRPVAHWPSSLRELRLDLKAPATLLPRWAKALPGLQILDLRLTDAPAPVPLAALAGFKQLRRLSLTGDGIQDLGPLAALPLERLALACEGADLAPVLTHPTLTTLEGDDALTARWARREALAGLSVQGIQAGLVARAPGTIIGALDALATWVELTSAPRHNTLYGLLGLTPSRDGGSPVEIPVLARALSLPDVSPGLAARVFAACFQSPQDNLAAALEAAEIVIERGTPTAQWALVDAVLAARARYDAGHREYDDSVHDQLLDDLLPRLGAGALVRLLKGLSDDDLDGDELEGLFAAAYAEATPTQTATLDARLRRYVAATRAQNPPSHFEDLLDDIVDVQPEAAERLADLR
ncbi:MAG: hypothetical protein KC613_18790, partial [Myxococcales bacterium]|nr:hypothetical protein [Myxococcales bacterium]